jgi:hypothetical protein
MKEVGAGKYPGRRRKTISPHIHVVPGAGKSPGRRQKYDKTSSLQRRKFPMTAPENVSPHKQVVSGAGKSKGRRRKVTDFRRRLGSDLSAPEMFNK